MTDKEQIAHLRKALEAVCDVGIDRVDECIRYAQRGLDGIEIDDCLKRYGRPWERCTKPVGHDGDCGYDA